MKNNVIAGVIFSALLSGIFGGVYFSADKIAGANPIVASDNGGGEEKVELKLPVEKEKNVNRKGAKKVKTKVKAKVKKNQVLNK